MKIPQFNGFIYVGFKFRERRFEAHDRTPVAAAGYLTSGRLIERLDATRTTNYSHVPPEASHYLFLYGEDKEEDVLLLYYRPLTPTELLIGKGTT